MFLLVLSSALGGARLASAGDDAGGFTGFRSPTSNIYCMYDAGYDTVPPSVRCDIREIDGQAPRPPSHCDGEWGRSFSVSHGEAAGELICTGDTVFSDGYPVLSYGGFWQQDGFTCTSEESGVTCFNEKRHGFKISRNFREVF